MPKLNIKKLTEAIAGLEAYKPPAEENLGVKYLYDMLYTPIANGGSMRICDIDYDAFTLEEVGDFEDYYDKIIYGHGSTAYNLSNKLRTISPVASKTRFI